jgi:hypothetical protein
VDFSGLVAVLHLAGLHVLFCAGWRGRDLIAMAVFSLADPLPIYLAGRRTYLRQFHQYKFVFTSLRDPARTRRSGLWGPVDMEEWLGSDARYAVIQRTAVDFYRARQGYAEILTEMDSLLARNFVLLEAFEENGGGTLSVYRRRGIMPAR